MCKISHYFAVSSWLVSLVLAGNDGAKANVENTVRVLWREPVDIARRDLFYGPGGRADAPRAPFIFEKEDLNGTNPKFVVRDAKGVRWTVKLGNEARSETVASRLVWAAGYFTNEDYFVRDLRVSGMPPHLKRGQKLVTAGGARNVRMKRHDTEEKKIGTWSWRKDPFRASREWNGLRVMMALINNWDLKDANNEIYRVKNSGDELYMVSDLGASLGPASHLYPNLRSKDDLDEYRRSKFITKETPEFVNFRVPGRPSWQYMVDLRSYIGRVRMEWIGKKVPREDAKWIGGILSRLSDAQIRDAFRAGGYSEVETAEFVRIVERRIAELGDL